MTVFVSSDGHKNLNTSLLIGFAEGSATERFAGKFELCSLNTEVFLGLKLQSKTAPLRKIVEVVEAKVERRKKENCIPIFPIMYFALCEKRVPYRSVRLFAL